ncbi:MAG: valine--tRNA ligase [Candidatus Eremiobacteraeota bacterium]|nr:valine--tRNA ligase [Candidatus Eremiobacteraeota bacterium]
MAEPMSDKYDPAAIEAAWYARWEGEGAFHVEPDRARRPFVIAMPPPNITGRAHMGHGSTYTPMDILTRWHRMLGDNAVWLPGQDHAAIATQNVVEKDLAREGLSRHQLGRAGFLARVWRWRADYGDVIYRQFRALGFSPDWQRDRFTMDPGLSAAVARVFAELYRAGLIYRGTRLINWCPRCASTLADTEVEREERPGSLYVVRYRADDGAGDILVATTRPETIFADVAIAVHPADSRYTALIGRKVRRPLSPLPIPVISDDAVDPHFGTGALKITPGHDQTDYDIGERHALVGRSVIGFDAKMTGDAEANFQGLDRFAARSRAVDVLRERDALVREEAHSVNVGLCYRCETVVEPLLSLQWFVRIKPLAEPALKASRDGRVRFIPARYQRTYEDWLERIRDWNISRQIWWGHRLPVWYCQHGHVNVAERPPATCEDCGSQELHQDEDTLDTWFSSALWPFTILGWPEKTAELEAWYPTQVLVTSRDIIFNWVARMVMMGLRFAGDVPFSEVFVTPLILDERGAKMSKSLGNALDPMQLIADFGADATRFGIVSQLHGSQDVRFATAKCDDARKFCNKLWQATRFALQSFPELGASAGPLALPPEAVWTLPDRYIMDRLAAAIGDVNQALSTFAFAAAAQTLYAFVWNDLCDVYVEVAKDKAPQRAPILARVLSATLQLIHPLMPFITEELWQRLPHAVDRIERSAWPSPAQVGRHDETARAQMDRLLAFVETLRTLRALPKLPYREMRDAIIVGDAPGLEPLLQMEAWTVRALGRAEHVRVLNDGQTRPPYTVSRRFENVQVLLEVDAAFIEKERATLLKESERNQLEIDKIERKLGASNFSVKAPAAVVEKERARLAELRTAGRLLDSRLRDL